MKYAALLLAALLAACASGGGGTYTPPTIVTANPMDYAAWQVGPVVNGVNYSSGATITPHAQGWQLTIPTPPGSAHYITMPTTSLEGKNRLVMQFRIELEAGARIVPSDMPQLTGMLTPYFERAGLCWSTQCETMRWYSPIRVRPLNAGEYVLEVPFVANWSAVLVSTRENSPTAYAQALANAGRIGFVLGGGNGVGHGVHATGPARIVITRFSVE